MLWFTEYYSGEGMDLKGTGLTIKVKNALTTKTPFQEILLLDTEDFGKMLVLDGAIQTTEKDEFIYHEMIVHPALFTLGRKPERVLVIGGGDGGTVREVIKHNPEKVELVEIDREVVEFAKRELPSISCALDDERVELIFDDGREYIKGKENLYDIIIVDCSDPIGPSRVLYEEEFYKDAFKALKDDGIFVTQSESPFAQNRVHKKVVKELQKVFSIVRPYFAFIPTYPSGMWSFTIGSKILDPLTVNPEKLLGKVSNLEKSAGKLKYYNSQIHYGAFAVPNFIYEEE
ncbi:Spermidine synthase [Desulfurobacterium thermolithotrophum DSM 11699]|uniref:Polyamine aminopropyltransferase n=1 Tax=Desulfurobacterium thermolithotrophum (strain DSM 11699 / BSA) TaxID=868864 RepID=F0S1F4_DESTD|nr:polyamine aminopropyltransferase [Desulfurobacterium thermolithotrophum]ADY72885.1 Spermidine synthase [Desulfurobacterium thermolithotrophum DSM 11699]